MKLITDIIETLKMAREIRRSGALSLWERHRDRSSFVETWSTYGQGAKIAERDAITREDLRADECNSNVKVAVRAISDAIRSLPLKAKILTIEDGIEVEEDAMESPLAAWIDKPNTEHDSSELMSHATKCYLLDGNAYFTIEKQTGPLSGLETWPRDPRYVKIMISRNGEHDGFKIGQMRNARTYPRNRVIHVRDIDPNRPFYGEGRIQGVRDEIALDNYVNQFNSNFFKKGGLINAMFSPKKELSTVQHKQLMDALKADLQGVDKMFSLFINRYPGEITFPEIKHKDIAFEGLLRMNREKIFSQFGLPPFRGGVMEYSNYANAVAQDKDFWNNTIKPILNVIEISFNRQLVRALLGEKMRLRFDMSDVPALKGDPKEQADIIKILVDSGIMDIDEAREQLKLPKREKPDSGPLEKQFIRGNRQRRVVAVAALHELTRGGKETWWLDGSDLQARKIYNVDKYNETDASSMLMLRAMLYQKCHQVGNGSAPNSYITIDNSPALPLIVRFIQERNRQTYSSVRSMFGAASKAKSSYADIVKQLRVTLSDDRARETARIVSEKIDQWANTIVWQQSERK